MSLEDRVAQLEQQLAALQQQASAGGDTLSPNYLTVDLQGHVGAVFTGLIKALGMLIPESTNVAVPTLPNAIEWQDQRAANLGEVREVVEGSSPVLGTHRLVMLAQNTDVGELAQFTAQVGANSVLRADTEGAGVQIIGADSTSDFLQLGTNGVPAAVFLEQGTATVTWGGASIVSGVAAVAFPAGFSNAVVALLTSTQLSTAGQVNFPNASGVTIAGFNVVATAPAGAPAAGVQATVSWLAIGK